MEITKKWWQKYNNLQNMEITKTMWKSGELQAEMLHHLDQRFHWSGL